MDQQFSLDRLAEFITNHHFLFIGLLVVSVLLLQDLISSLFRKFHPTSPVGAVELLNDDATVVDVREPFEFKKGHIANAINIPFGKFDQQIDRLETRKSDPVVVTCKTGSQSSQVCKKLCKSGFQRVYLLQGGMQAWQDLNLPIQRDQQTAT
jgi:rhodanese-related sulfurtransferase